MSLRKRLKEEKGITLIALVITIIVLIILAVVSINIIFGENGMFGTAKEARQYQLNAEAYDNEKMQEIANSIQAKVDEITNGTTGEDGLEGLSSEETILLPTGVTEKTIENILNENLKNPVKIKAVITDSDGGEVPIPKGANYKEGTECGFRYQGHTF